ncbi:MAG: hypothetical protein ACPG8W_00365 [Candidatus Promineifilaceae bacterium]
MIRQAEKQAGLRCLYGQETSFVERDGDQVTVHMKIPTFGEAMPEPILNVLDGNVYEDGGFYLIETPTKLVGALVREIDFPLESHAFEVYKNLLRITEGWNFFRIWNYVPYINEEQLGMENYKSFCKGRSLAFEDFLGRGFELELSAASAVGIEDNKLVVYFIAGKEEGMHVENPEQVAAFRYPEQYGPRPPSFARGTLVANGVNTGYISGTASIKSHESVTLSGVSEQLYTTVDNISLVFERMGLLPERMSYASPFPDRRYKRHFKVYIRHEEDAPAIRQQFEQMIGVSDLDSILYLKADICRYELDLEIESVIESY